MRPLLLRAACCRRRWPLLSAIIVFGMVAVLVSEQWKQAAELERPEDDLERSEADMAKATPPQETGPQSAPTPEKREFYGAARTLFSSNSLNQAKSLKASQEPETPSVTAAGLPSDAIPGSPPPPSGPETSKVRAFSRYDHDLDLVDQSTLEPLTAKWLKAREAVYQQRKSRLREVCAARGVRLAQSRTERSVLSAEVNHIAEGPEEVVKASHFTVVPPLKTMTCLVNKVASTSLLETFLKITGHGVPVFETLGSPHSIAKLLHPTKPGQFELAQKQYFKFLLVRHPLERLISAYEDKVVRADHPSLIYLRKAVIASHERSNIREDVYQQLRSPDANETAILARHDVLIAAYRAEVQQRGGVPSFTEFLDFALASDPTGDSFDSHWTPYWRQCTPCHIDYDVIGNLETARDDFKYLWHRMKIYTEVKIPRQNALHGSSSVISNQRLASSSVASDQHLASYLAPVPAATVAKLRDMFKLDFDMFGYDWEGMLQLSGHCKVGVKCVLA